MTKEEVKEYIDNYIKHAISMVEFGNFFAHKVKALTDQAEEDCNAVLEKYKTATTKSVCSNCQREIDLILYALEDDITLLVENSVNDMSEKEKEWLSNFVASPLGIEFSFADKANDLLMLIPVATAGVVGKFGETVSDRLRNIYQQKVVSSYISGASFEDLEDSFQSRFNSFNRGLEADSETLGSSLSEQYDRVVYTRNSKKIKGYIWSAILDSHTCIVCGELDGQRFDDISKVPMYPVHDRCRCTLIPFTEDIEEELPSSYKEWFEVQPKETKRQILGKKRFELYESGVKVKNFVNNGKITPLKDLKIQK